MTQIPSRSKTVYHIRQYSPKIIPISLLLWKRRPPCLGFSVNSKVTSNLKLAVRRWPRKKQRRFPPRRDAKTCNRVRQMH